MTPTDRAILRKVATRLHRRCIRPKRGVAVLTSLMLADAQNDSFYGIWQRKRRILETTNCRL
jgi:hypothetical protein